MIWFWYFIHSIWYHKNCCNSWHQSKFCWISIITVSCVCNSSFLICNFEIFALVFKKSNIVLYTKMHWLICWIGWISSSWQTIFTSKISSCSLCQRRWIRFWINRKFHTANLICCASFFKYLFPTFICSAFISRFIITRWTCLHNHLIFCQVIRKSVITCNWISKVIWGHIYLLICSIKN